MLFIILTIRSVHCTFLYCVIQRHAFDGTHAQLQNFIKQPFRIFTFDTFILFKKWPQNLRTHGVLNESHQFKEVLSYTQPYFQEHLYKVAVIPCKFEVDLNSSSPPHLLSHKLFSQLKQPRFFEAANQPLFWPRKRTRWGKL